MSTYDPQSIISALQTPKPNTPTPRPANRRIRIVFSSTYICDTTSALFVWEHPYYPYFYVPGTELQNKAIVASNGNIKGPDKTVIAGLWKVRAKGAGIRPDGQWHEQGEGKTFDAIYFTPGKWPVDEQGVGLGGLVRVPFKDMDAWYEENTPIHMHPKDPTKRISILPSSRPLSIRIDSLVLAESSAYQLLIEPMLPVRYYIPFTDINPKFLRPSKKGTTTKCPYKGDAEYCDLIVGEQQKDWEFAERDEDGHMVVVRDAVWWYRYPEQECVAVAGLACFYDEKVEVWVDGEKKEKVRSKFV